MTKILTLEQQYGGKNLPDAEWAKILQCNAVDIPEFRDFLQSPILVCIAKGWANNKTKYTTEQFAASKDKDLGFVWWLSATCTISFDDYKSAEKFTYEQWIPNIIFPDKMPDGRAIPQNAHLLVRIGKDPRVSYGDERGRALVPSARVCAMTPQELALCQKYYGNRK